MKSAALIATVIFIGCGDTVVAAQGVDEPCGPTLSEGGTADEEGGTPVSGEPNGPGQREAFPFTICGDRFCRDGSPVFLNIVAYQPLRPCEHPFYPPATIDEGRVLDDLRRLDAYRGGSDPVVLRLYPQPVGTPPRRMPQSFYDGVRKLGFWIIPDIYFEFPDPEADDKIRAVIQAIEDAGALDLVFAWEFMKEYNCTAENAGSLSDFLRNRCAYLKEQMHTPARLSFSDFVTWASWPRCDPLYTELAGYPVVPDLDFYSYNLYPYWPEHIRDHQGGYGTGTPYAGYLAALKDYIARNLENKPLVISETGFPDSQAVGDGDQRKLKRWYPVYTWGGLNSEQVAEGLADRYWDARLTGVAGISIFEWNDEWWKAGEPCIHNDTPEEYFGLLSFDKYEHNVIEQARFKLQQETVRDLYTMKFPVEPPFIKLIPTRPLIAKNENTTVRACVSETKFPVRLRWEATRGRVVGDTRDVAFYAGGRSLGPATVTATVVEGQGLGNTASATIAVTTSDSPWIECLTLGPGPLERARASGRVGDVDLSTYKVVVYVLTDKYYVQPYRVMKSIWIRPDGYWWTQVRNENDGQLHAWVVPISPATPPDEAPAGWSPPGFIAECVLNSSNDSDNDLLPDPWELTKFSHLAYDRYDDREPDPEDGSEGDLADNLEEFLAWTDPTVPDNDGDSDGLPDTWESLYFGTLDFDADDDPDADGLDNAAELAMGIHPGRTAVDRDRDGLPDSWEMRWCETLGVNPDALCTEGYTNRDAYDLERTPCCKSGAFIIHGYGGVGETSPCTGYIDPRIENLNPDDRTPKLGVKQITIVFSEPLFSPRGGPVRPADFVISETKDGVPPIIIGVSTPDNIEFKIELDRPITLRQWTTIQAVVVDACDKPIVNLGDLGPGNPEPDRVDYGFLPGDINQDGGVTPQDLINLRQYFAGYYCGPCADELYFDIDRDGAFPLPTDLIKFRQILGGQPPATRSWAGETMNTAQP